MTGVVTMSHSTEHPLWTRLRCSRCRYVQEHPGPVTEGDLDAECKLCRAPLGAVTVFKLGTTADCVADRPA